MTASTATDDPNTMTGNLYSDRNLLDKYYVTPMQYFYEYSIVQIVIAHFLVGKGGDGASGVKVIDCAALLSALGAGYIGYDCKHSR